MRQLAIDRLGRAVRAGGDQDRPAHAPRRVVGGAAAVGFVVADRLARGAPGGAEIAGGQAQLGQARLQRAARRVVVDQAQRRHAALEEDAAALRLAGIGAERHEVGQHRAQDDGQAGPLGVGETAFEGCDGGIAAPAHVLHVGEQVERLQARLEMGVAVEQLRRLAQQRLGARRVLAQAGGVGQRAQQERAQRRRERIAFGRGERGGVGERAVGGAEPAAREARVREREMAAQTQLGRAVAKPARAIADSAGSAASSGRLRICAHSARQTSASIAAASSPALAATSASASIAASIATTS